MRREKKIDIDPNTEEQRSRDELAAAVGEKKLLESQMLSIADTKRKLEAEMEESAARFDAQVKKQAQEFDAIVSGRNRVIADLDAKRDKIKAEIESEGKNLAVAKNEISRATRTNNELKLSNDTMEADKVAGKVLLNALYLDRKNVSDQVDHLTHSRKTLENENIKLGDRGMELRADIGRSTTLIDNHNNALQAGKLAYTQLMNDIDMLSKALSVKEQEIRDQNNMLSELQKKAADHTLAMNKKTEEVNERVRNLSVLDQRIDEKMDILKQYKAKFSVDELAKMKVKIDIV